MSQADLPSELAKDGYPDAALDSGINAALTAKDSRGLAAEELRPQDDGKGADDWSQPPGLHHSLLRLSGRGRYLFHLSSHAAHAPGIAEWRSCTVCTEQVLSATRRKRMRVQDNITF